MEKTKRPIQERVLYIPQMSYEGARCMAAAFNSIGIEAYPSPDGDNTTLELARKYLSGDECLPEAVTLGNFLKVAQFPNYDPEKTAFLMPTSNGPCRFGHYKPLVEKIFKERKEPVLFVSPTSSDGYAGIGNERYSLVRTGWRAVVTSDILRKMLLKTRPYEKNVGNTDRVFKKSLDLVCNALSKQNISHRQRLNFIVDALSESLKMFKKVPVKYPEKRLVIGIVGEIFCRFNEFSNNRLIRTIERFGAEAWISDIGEWVWYTNDERILNLKRDKRFMSLELLKNKLQQSIMHSDEHRLLEPFKTEFEGYEEPSNIRQLLDKSKPYLPRESSHGEMIINVGRTIWYFEKGAAGVIDISPFTCMNGIVCESVYPKVSRDHRNFPIRIFYFDGLQTDFDNDVEIFIELAKNYKNY